MNHYNPGWFAEAHNKQVKNIHGTWIELMFNPNSHGKSREAQIYNLFPVCLLIILICKLKSWETDSEVPFFYQNTKDKEKL